MKRICAITCLLLMYALPLFAQDGWLLSATPPLVVRFDRKTVAINFTNTSDKVLHGIKLTSIKDGQTTSRVIIDTIQPHETFVMYSSEYLANDGMLYKQMLSDASLTCTDYSKPLRIDVNP